MISPHVHHDFPPTVLNIPNGTQDNPTVLIIVDCITENGPIPGALWTFSTESKTKREEKHDFQFIETAVAKKEY